MRLAQKDRQAREAGPFPPTLGEGEGTATRRLPRVPCDISIGSSRIPLDNICVKRHAAAVARNCHSNRRETGTQIGQIGKTENRIEYQIRKPIGIFGENRKPNAGKWNICKPQ